MNYCEMLAEKAKDLELIDILDNIKDTRILDKISKVIDRVNRRNEIFEAFDEFDFSVGTSDCVHYYINDKEQKEIEIVTRRELAERLLEQNSEYSKDILLDLVECGEVLDWKPAGKFLYREV